MRATNLAALAALLITACASAPEEHARVASESSAEQRGISLSVMLVELPAAKLAELSKGCAQNGVVPAGFGETLLAAAGADASVRHHPRLVLSNGSEGEISVSEHPSFTKDFEDGPDGRPREVRGTLDEGFWVRARPTATALDGAAAIELDLSLRFAKILRPIRTAMITLNGSGEQRVIDLPELAERRTTNKSVLRPGEALLVDLALSLPDGLATVAIVTPAFVDLPREASFRTRVEGASVSVLRR
jgi:hypothetical protein